MTAFQKIGRWGSCACLWWWLHWILLPAPAWAETPPTEVPAAEAALIQRIDELIRLRWQQEGVKPAAPAGDAEFLRRVYLDLAGKIPPTSAVRSFLADPRPDKRRLLVQELLEGPRYIIHFSAVWRSELLPEVMGDPNLQFLRPAFDAWLRDQLIDNTSYAEIARQIMTWPLPTQGVMQQVGPGAGGNEATPLAFYQAKGNKPETVAGGVARVFLGLRIECAQCHNHPFDSWKQEQFWSFAAFFAEVDPATETNALTALFSTGKRRSLTIPGKGTVVEASFLDGKQPEWKKAELPREKFSEWLLSHENPYFARAAVNRIWGRLFGAGIVEPVDDFSGANPPSHPELLDELARAFAEQKHDLKFLIRVLTATEAYQLSSRQTDPSQEPPQLFARMATKGLTAEQIYDSLAEASGRQEQLRIAQPDFLANDNSPRSQFIDAFSNDSGESVLERQTSILQALALMNGEIVANATRSDGLNTVASATKFPGLSLRQRIEVVFLTVLSRQPNEQELKRLEDYARDKPLAEALGDIFWTLVNTSEFLLNH